MTDFENSDSFSDKHWASPVTILQPSHQPKEVNVERIHCQCGKLAIKRYVEKFDSAQISQGYYLCGSGKCKFFLWASNVPSTAAPPPPAEDPPRAPVGEESPRCSNEMSFGPPAGVHAASRRLQPQDEDEDEGQADGDDDETSGVRCQCQRFAERHAVLVETAIGTQVGQGYYTCARGKCKFFLWASALTSSPAKRRVLAATAEAPLGPRLHAMLTVLTSLQAAVETARDSDLSHQSERIGRVLELVRRRLIFDEDVELLSRALKAHLRRQGGKRAVPRGSQQSVQSLSESFVQHVEFIKNM